MGLPLRVVDCGPIRFARLLLSYKVDSRMAALLAMSQNDSPRLDRGNQINRNLHSAFLRNLVRQVCVYQECHTSLVRCSRQGHLLIPINLLFAPAQSS